MQNLESQPYTVQVVALYAIEGVYQRAWSAHSPMNEPYGEFADQWGNDVFGKYVGQLEEVTDRALNDPEASGDLGAAEATFKKVLEMEVAFWDMAYSA